MSKANWLQDMKGWLDQSLTYRLDELRKHYCTGPCGQSSSVMSTREATDRTLRDAIHELVAMSACERKLLEACKAVLDDGYDTQGANDSWEPSFVVGKEVIDQLRTAIARAEGKE